MKRLLLLLPLVLSACSLGGPRPGATWHVLEDRGRAVAPAPRPVWPGTLLIRETEASGFYQNDSLAYSRAPGTRNHYQYARQPEAPAPRLAQLMRRRLEQSGLFSSVSTLGSGVSGDYQLNSRLLDLYHDAALPPGEVRLVLELELVRMGDGRQMATQRIETSAPAQSHDAAGAAAASSVALGEALDRMLAWLGKPIP